MGGVEWGGYVVVDGHLVGGRVCRRERRHLLRFFLSRILEVVQMMGQLTLHLLVLYNQKSSYEVVPSS
jgi:hypothetical protein